MKEKGGGKQDNIWAARAGIRGGLEHLLPVMMTFGVHAGRISIEEPTGRREHRQHRRGRPGGVHARLRLDLGLAIAVIAVALTTGLFVFMSRTRVGLANRATRMNLESAKLMGVPIGVIYAVTFGLGAALAGAAGSLMAIAYVITPVMGPSYLLRAFTICILGGLGNIYGALVGGLLFGLVETLGGLLLGTGFQEVIGMLMLVFVLLVRPSGIMGKRFYEI